MMRSLTALQHSVVDRLRRAGHTGLAEEAQEAWSRGACLVGYYLGRSVGDESLRTDFEFANTGVARRVGPA